MIPMKAQHRLSVRLVVKEGRAKHLSTEHVIYVESAEGYASYFTIKELFHRGKYEI